MDRWLKALEPPTAWLTAPPEGIWTVADDPSGVTPFLPNGEYVARLKRNGRLDRILVERASGSARLDSAVIRAFRVADSLRAFDEIPEQILRSRADWRVIVGTAHPVGRAARYLSEDTLRTLVVDTAPVLLRRSTSFTAAMSASTAGSGFVVEYVVSREGRVDPASVRMLWASNPDIAKEVVKSARSSIYRPGIAGGCPVPVAVIWRQQLGAGPYDPAGDQGAAR